MSFEIKAEGVDVEAVQLAIRQRIEEKKKGLYDDAELQALAERDLEPVLDTGDVPGALLEELRARDAQWNYSFDPETLYRSSRGAVGQALEMFRRALRPIQKLFWNPNPMISALSRQSDLNRYSAHLFHNLVVELTRLNLEVRELKSRNLQLAARLDLLARREKTLESMVVYRDGSEGAEPDRG
ncbi:MAG: hypothetical protein LJF30_21460 [Acidobacteria bacterium]|jgi:hypothetical protein|nr:hypothetical protein [Acidobacteriota bacterium]